MVNRASSFSCGIHLVCGGWVVCALLAAGCSSSKPPPPLAPAQTAAEGTSAQAAKLSEAGNWPAAAGQWSKAVDQYRLLNNLPRLAVALHNLGVAQAEQGNIEEGEVNLEQAAALNDSLGLEEEWWRNQIALLQVEAMGTDAAPLQKRFEELLPKSSQQRDPVLLGLFLNEVGLWMAQQAKTKEAAESYRDAELHFQQARSVQGVATVQANRADLLTQEKNFEAALQVWTEALAKFESLADPPRITRALAGKGRALLESGGDAREGIALLERAAANYRVLGDARGELPVLKALEAAYLQRDSKADADRIIARRLQLESAKH